VLGKISLVVATVAVVYMLFRRWHSLHLFTTQLRRQCGCN
jgi:hypothetical protein